MLSGNVHSACSVPNNLPNVPNELPNGGFYLGSEQNIRARNFTNRIKSPQSDQTLRAGS